ncbi:MAG: M24 family metallopeptidase [Phycisphaerales bacterium JB040]
MRLSFRIVSTLALALLAPQRAPAHEPGVILTMRERARVIDRWTEQRLDRIVPALMRTHAIDTWIIIGREYDEDPVLETMLPATWLSARRRTILVLHDPGPNAQLERLAVARYSVGDSFEAAWDPESQPDQWARLAEIIEQRDPAVIALNTSSDFAHADGLSHTQHTELLAVLPQRFHDRIVSAEPLAVGWLERRLPEETEVYASICRLAHEIMGEALSERVIQPGVTTTHDVEWWLRERVRELRLTAWFHPSVSLQRPERTGDFLDYFTAGDDVIHRGDLVHLDFGITYLRLNTDTQQMAYVLRPGETEPPAGLRDAFRVGNRLQDILTSHFVAGRTGNQVLRAALDQAEAEGINAMIYTHPIGYHGHGAGPAIGMWDKQEGVPGTGDYPVHDGTAYSIELNAEVPVLEWNFQPVRIMLEEDALFENGSVRYLDGRQTELLIVR